MSSLSGVLFLLCSFNFLQTDGSQTDRSRLFQENLGFIWGGFGRFGDWRSFYGNSIPEPPPFAKGPLKQPGTSKNFCCQEAPGSLSWYLKQQKSCFDRLSCKVCPFRAQFRVKRPVAKLQEGDMLIAAHVCEESSAWWQGYHCFQNQCMLSSKRSIPVSIIAEKSLKIPEGIFCMWLYSSESRKL